MFDTHAALTLCAAAVAITLGICTVELLSLRTEFRQYGLFGYAYARVNMAGSPFARMLNFLNHPRCFVGILLPMRLGAAIFTAFFALVYGEIQLPSLLILTGTTWIIHHRCKLGLDGSDAIALIIVTALAIASLYPSGDIIRRAALVFIAGQTVLAYVTAGIFKLMSPTWMQGDALVKVISVETYGSPWLARHLQKYPRFSKLANWGVVFAESAFFVVLFFPPEILLVCLALGVCFHLACGLVMGLNTFVWAFLAGYPAIIWVNGQLYDYLMR